MKLASRVVLVVFFLLSFIARAQDTVQKKSDSKKTNLGISVQAYPAGIIPTVNLEHYVSKKSSLLFRLGYNIVDRQDFSDENETETGGGFGGSMGYRRHFPLNKGKIVAGFHTDIWNLDIDWTDTISGTLTSGTTNTIVIQPWLEAGYFFPIRTSELGITAGFGREINAVTNGDDVEQGFIASISLQYYFSL